MEYIILPMLILFIDMLQTCMGNAKSVIASESQK